jgi:leader peptidase (prepilin peptidase)/N-methyltransferase
VLTTVFIFIFGLCIGSFLTVVVYRVPRKISVVNPIRSFCPDSETTLSWWENIPLISYAILRGKSRYSNHPIPGKYPLIEIVCGFSALASYARYGASPTAVVVFALLAALIAITWIDLEFLIIPNVISFPGMTIGLLLGIASQYTSWFGFPITQGAFDSLLGFLVGGGFFYIIGVGYYICTKRVGLGGGDIKLMGMTGAILGINSVIPTVLVGSIAGVVVGIMTIILKGGSRHSEIPFGPWLALGAAVYMFSDPNLFAVYALRAY